jgi:hypothetical protein
LGESPPAVQVPELLEASGMVASELNPGVIWAHNDSGDVARVFAFDAAGAARGAWDIAGAEAMDWEDMAKGPGPDEDAWYLYLGDIGDNGSERPEIVVYRVREPEIGDGAGGTLEGAERIVLRYPDSPHDAETLLVDPFSGDLVIVTKEVVVGDAGIYVAPWEMLGAGGGVMERAGTITKATLTPSGTASDDASVLVRGVGWLPTSGDLSADGGMIAIRTYATVWIWARDYGETLAQALAGEPCEAASAVEAQGEAIAFHADVDGYYTISEGAAPALNTFE